VTHFFFVVPVSSFHLAREIENFLGRKEKKETTITLDPHISPHAKKYQI